LFFDGYFFEANVRDISLDYIQELLSSNLEYEYILNIQYPLSRLSYSKHMRLWYLKGNGPFPKFVMQEEGGANIGPTI